MEKKAADRRYLWPFKKVLKTARNWISDIFELICRVSKETFYSAYKNVMLHIKNHCFKTYGWHGSDNGF